MELLGALGVGTFFGYIAFYAPPGKMTPGDLMQFCGCIFLLYQPIKSLIRLHNQLEQARVVSQMVFSLLDIKNDIVEPENPKLLVAKGSDVTFEHINFSYGEKPVLHDYSLTVKAGKLVALVGASGGGKTTVTNLILRFHDPQSGRITIGGTDIRDVLSSDLRNQIAVVTQETVLFNDTIYNNIALGRTNATREEVIQAAKQATRTTSSWKKPKATTASSEKKASCSPADNASGSPSRAPSSKTRPSSSSTKPPMHSTPNPNASCKSRSRR